MNKQPVTIETIIRYLKGQLADAEKQQFIHQMNTSADVKALVNFLSMAKDVLYPEDVAESSYEVTPSKYLVNWAKKSNPYRLKRAPVKKPLFAVLKNTFDELTNIVLGLASQLALAKGSVSLPILNYEVVPYQINLEICSTLEPEVKQLDGKITWLENHRPVVSSTIQLSHPDWDTLTTATDNFGNFIFPKVSAKPDDLFDLSIELDDQIIYIEKISMISSISI